MNFNARGRCGRTKAFARLRGVAADGHFIRVDNPPATRLRQSRTRWLNSTAWVSLSSLLTISAAYGATTNWTGGASDGNWFTAGNWSAGVPTSADTATIP